MGTLSLNQKAALYSVLLLIGGLSWSLCLLSAWLPARRAALLNPIEGLHS